MPRDVGNRIGLCRYFEHNAKVQRIAETNEINPFGKVDATCPLVERDKTTPGAETNWPAFSARPCQAVHFKADGRTGNDQRWRAVRLEFAYNH